MLREIQLISTQQLAEHLGYQSVSASFYDFCRHLRIAPVPGRRGWYDPKLVRSRLDQAQGMERAEEGISVGSATLVDRRRARLGKA
jgi:hypothetical protein